MSKDSKNKKKKKKSNSENGEQIRYSGSLALSKLVHVRMKKKGKKGKKVDCLIIPIKANYLVEGKEGAVYMPISVVIKPETDQHGQDGFVGQQADTKVWKAADKKEQKKINDLPILGSIKNFGAGGGNAASGSAGEVGEDDDLPF